MKYLSLFLFFSVPTLLFAESISFDDFLKEIKEAHPVFESYQKEILAKQAEAEGSYAVSDWRITADTGVLRSDSVEPSAFSPENRTQYTLNSELSKSFTDVGGTLGIEVTQRKEEQTDRVGAAFDFFPNDYYQSGAFLRYSQSLFKNRNGLLTRYPIERAALEREQSEVFQIEQAEKELFQFAVLYINWVRRSEELKLLKGKKELNKKQLEHMQRKSSAGIVTKADLYRTEQDFWSAKQAYEQGLSLYEAQAARVRVLLRGVDNKDLVPAYDLFHIPKLPQKIDDPAKLRILTSLAKDKKLEELNGQRAKEEQRQDVSLQLRAGLQDGAEERSAAFDYEEPEFFAGLSYERVFGEKAAGSRETAARYRAVKMARRYDSRKREFESEFARMTKLLTHLKNAIASTKKQIQAAEQRVKEEEELYRQGRGELNFVIQSRDSEQAARLRHVDLAALYHLGIVELKELQDKLW